MTVDASLIFPPNSRSLTVIFLVARPSLEKARLYVRPAPSPKESDRISGPRPPEPEKTCATSFRKLQLRLPHPGFLPPFETHLRWELELSRASPHSPSGSCFQDPWEERAAHRARKKTFGPTA